MASFKVSANMLQPCGERQQIRHAEWMCQFFGQRDGVAPGGLCRCKVAEGPFDQHEVCSRSGPRVLAEDEGMVGIAHRVVKLVDPCEALTRVTKLAAVEMCDAGSDIGL